MEVFNMADNSDCDEYSLKLEDIHLVNTRHLISSQHLHLNQLVSDYLPKSSVQEESQQSFMPSFWPLLFEDTLTDALPDFSHDITLQNLIADDSSLDFGRNLFQIPTTLSNTTESNTQEVCSQFVHSHKTSPSGSVISSVSPTLFGRSRPGSVSPTREVENGSDKKRARFEKEETSEGVAHFMIEQSLCDNQEFSEVFDMNAQSGGGVSNTLSQSPLLQSFLNSTILFQHHQSRIPTTTTISLAPFLSTITNSGMNNRLILIPTPTLPDLTEGQTVEHSVITPPPHNYFHHYYNHPRSCSTSPEHREEYGAVRRKDAKSAVDAGKGDAKGKIPRHKRPSHINAEHRRRFKIQNGIEELNQLLPVQPGGTRTSVGGSKKSNAALLSRAAGYCRQLKAECRESEREADALRTEIESLSVDINCLHERLPVDGMPAEPRLMEEERRVVPIEQMFDNYVRARTENSWKFYIFGLLLGPFFNSYNRIVVSSSREAFEASVKEWVTTQFTLSSIRKISAIALRYCARMTGATAHPEKLPQDALRESMAGRHSLPDSFFAPPTIGGALSTTLLDQSSSARVGESNGHQSR